MKRFDLSAADDEARSRLARLVLGRTGKLRAPTLRVADRLVVGFNREMLDSVFGTTP